MEQLKITKKELENTDKLLVAICFVGGWFIIVPYRFATHLKINGICE